MPIALSGPTSQLATFPTVAYQICLNQAANDPLPPAAVWSDITSRVRGDGSPVSTSRGRQYELGTATAGTATMRWRNDDGVFTLGGANALSGLAAYRKFRARATWGPGNVVTVDFTSPNSTWTATNATLASALRQLGPLGQVGKSGLLTATGAGTASATIATARPVTASTTYSLLGYFQPLTVGRTCQAQVSWFDGTSTLIRTDTVASVTTTVGAWGKSSGLVTSPSNAVTATVTFQVLAPGAGEQHYMSNAALLPGDTLATDWQPATADATRGVFGGLVERFPLKWDMDGVYGVCEPTLVDALAGIAQIGLSRVVSSEILLDAPLVYYPLQEPSASSTAGDFSSGSTGPLVPITTKYGGSGVAFGQPTSLVDGDTAVQFGTGATAPGSTQAATILSAPSPLIPATGPFTVSCWANFGSATPTSTTTSAFIFTAAGPTLYPAFVIGLYSSGFVGAGKLAAQAQSTPGNASVATSNNVLCDGKWHHILITFLGDAAATMNLWIDNHLDMTATAPAGVTFEQATFCQFGGANLPAYSIYGGQSTFQMAHFAVFPGVLSSTRIAAHYAAGKTAFAGETSGARINRLLSYGPYSGAKAVDAGTSLMGPALGLQDQKLLQAVQDVTTTEDGNLFVAGDGTLTWKGRAARITQLAPAWVFGSNVAAGELPFLGDVGYSADPQYVYGEVVCDRPQGITVSLQDASSDLQYFPRTLTRTLNVNSDDQVLDMASVLSERYKQPSLRLDTLTFRPSAHPRAWWAALAIEIGDRVTVNHRPSDGSPAIGADFYVEKIDHEIVAGDWIVKLQMSPVPSTVYTVMGALRTSLSASSLANATTLSLTPFSDSGRNPVEANLTPGTLWRINPGGVGDETVGVTAVVSSHPGLTQYTSATATIARVLGSSNTVATALGIATDPATGATNRTLTLSGTSNASTTAVIVDGEVMTVTAGAGTASLTVTRGGGVTSQAPHAIGAAVVELGGGAVNAHASGVTICEQLTGSNVDPSFYDPAAVIGSFVAAVKTTVAATVSSISLLALSDWPRNLQSSALSTGLVLYVDAGGSQERMQVLSVTSSASDGSATVTFGSLLTVACASAATTVTVKGQPGTAGGWVAGQKVGVSAGATFATVNTVTDNKNGTVTLGLSAGTPTALEIGAVLFQFTQNAHTAGALVADASSVQAGSALAA